MAALEKIYNCMSCGAEIRLERKPDNSGWLRWNLDGSEHIDAKKKPKQQAVVDNGQKITDLANQVRDLKETVNILIAQIQMLRSEVKSKMAITKEHIQA